MTPMSTNPSRKRSRDESAFDVNADGGYFHAAEVRPPEPIPEEPIYGEGMVLINPRTGVALSADSQTGTWYEEKADHESLKREIEEANFRPRLPTSRKSMRLSQTSIKTGFDTLAASEMATAHSNNNAPASPPKTSAGGPHPEIDDATMALGIGWTKISGSSDTNMQSAARGWARYLENHYARHVHGAEILLQSTGLNAYLVGCREGFYLFAENLLEGRLVSRSWEGCLENLRARPNIVFEGEQTLTAERTPGPDLGGFGVGAQRQGEGKEEESMQMQATAAAAAAPEDEDAPVSVTPQNWAEYHRLQTSNGAWVGRMEMD